MTLAAHDWSDADRMPAGAELVVRDTGMGIASEDPAAIFDPVFTTKKDSGTGLGLSVTYTIVERHGARITVASQPGEGTEFHLG